MKQGIHPEYVECTVKCSCGNTFTTRSTKSELKVDICNVCHPFYTGQQRFVDTGGRVQRFADKFGSAKEQVAAREAAKKAERAAKAAEMATSMCGMDTLVFTAGIGEHAPAVRAGVADRLAFMGVKMDHARNALRGDGAWCLSAKDSKVKIFVIPTDEEFMIASDVERIVNGK